MSSTIQERLREAGRRLQWARDMNLFQTVLRQSAHEAMINGSMSATSLN